MASVSVPADGGSRRLIHALNRRSVKTLEKGNQQSDIEKKVGEEPGEREPTN
jgi:hypothetical protein